MSLLAGGQRRLESETYLTGGHAIHLAVEHASVPHITLGAIAAIWSPGRLKGISVAPGHGLPFLTATQCFDIRPTPRKWLSVSRTPDLDQRFVRPGWILATCSGNVGEATLSYTAHEKMIISHDLLRIQARDPVLRGYVYAFLRSRYGRAMMRSSQYGSIIKHLEPEHVRALPIPTPPTKLAQHAEQTAAKVLQLRTRALTRLNDAYAAFERSVGAPSGGLRPTTYSVSAADVFGGRRRLDGAYYNPTAQAAEQALRATGRAVVPLTSVVDRIILPNRFKRIYMKQGIPFLDSEDIFKLNPEVTKFIPAQAKKDAAKYGVQRGWLLVARSGQLYGLNGSVMLADVSHEGAIVSEHIVRVVPSTANVAPASGYLAAALGHPRLGRPLVLRLAFGTEIPEIATEDLATFPLVRLDPPEEAHIATAMEDSSALRGQANAMENASVAAVESWLTDVLGPAAAEAAGAVLADAAAV